MTNMTSGELAFAAFMLAGKTLETLQEKGVLSQAEALQTIRDAKTQLEMSTNPDAQGAARVLEHFYSSGSTGTP